MTRRSGSLAAVLFVTATAAAGFICFRFGQATTAEANALPKAEANRLYEELEGDGSALIEGSRVLSKVARLVTPSVVHIQSVRAVRGRQMEETGSGVLMSSPKAPGVYVVSNRHVVQGARLEDIEVRLSAPDARVLTPTRMWTDKDTDVAVLKLDAPGLQPARWGNSQELEIGHMVLAMGSPFGLSQSVTYGIISAKGRRSLRLGNGPDVLNQDFIQTDAAINPGNSGGPLVDMHGRVVGINTAIASNSGGNEGIGFSIPSNLVHRVMDELLRSGRVRRAYLGVKLDPEFSAETAARFRLDRARGARVVEVYADTPAAKAKLMTDDIVLTFNGTRVEDENHLINLVSLTDIDRQVTLEVLRDGRTITIRVQLGDRTELEQRSSATPRPQPRFEYAVEPMGLSVESVDAQIAAQIGLDASAEGLLVTHIESDSEAANELQLYDVIVEVARQPIRSVTDLRRVLAEIPADRCVVRCLRTDREGSVQSRLLFVDRKQLTPPQRAARSL